MNPTRIAGPTGMLALDDGGQGSGAPVVLAHSLAGTAGHWSHQLPHLRSSRRAVAFDFRAHGASDPARNRDYSIGGLAGGAVALRWKPARWLTAWALKGSCWWATVWALESP